VGRRVLQDPVGVPGESRSGDQPSVLRGTGVEINEVFYEGQTSAVFDHSQTLLTLKIPAHPQMPGFKEVMVSCFENSTLEAHQSCARIALKEVCKQLSLRLKDTPFSVLLTAV
jgi:hypothetical protein